MARDSLGKYNTKLASRSVRFHALFTTYYLQALARELLPEERVKICMRAIKFGRSTVDIVRIPDTRKARYKGLIRCTSIWNCPVCASQITEHRRIELSKALAKSTYKVALITYTIRHNYSQSLVEILGVLKTAYDRMKSGRASVELREDFGWIGSIRSLEITHGSNGWHPHMHELVLFDEMDTDIARKLEIEMQDRWVIRVQQVGGSANRANGLTVLYSEKDISDYLEKWGRLPKQSSWTIVHELTKQPVKVGRRGGRTPYELLIDYGGGDKQSGALFVEYASAFKGSSQLQWSRGLRDLLGIGKEQSDSGVIEEEDSADHTVLARLERQDWVLILNSNKQAELLNVAGSGSESDIWEFIEGLR